MDSFDNLMEEVSQNVRRATESINKMQSQNNKFKLHLGVIEELQPRETSVAIKKTAENVIKLIINVTQPEKEEIQETFLEFKSNAEKRVSQVDGKIPLLQYLMEPIN